MKPQDTKLPFPAHQSAPKILRIFRLFLVNFHVVIINVSAKDDGRRFQPSLFNKTLTVFWFVPMPCLLGQQILLVYLTAIKILWHAFVDFPEKSAGCTK